jgi:hypothetical protein
MNENMGRQQFSLELHLLHLPLSRLCSSLRPLPLPCCVAVSLESLFTLLLLLYFSISLGLTVYVGVAVTCASSAVRAVLLCFAFYNENKEEEAKRKKNNFYTPHCLICVFFFSVCLFETQAAFAFLIHLVAAIALVGMRHPAGIRCRPAFRFPLPVLPLPRRS